MLNYTYRAKTKDGEIVTGTIEAESESAAAKVLTEKKLFPISVSTKNDMSIQIFDRVPAKEKVIFFRQLSTTITAGLPISQALRTIEGQISNKSLKNIISQVIREVEGGSSLSASLSRFPKVFSVIDVTLISAGETSGSLDKVLKRLADTVDSDYKINRKIRSAMVYPAFVLVVVIGMVIAMAYYVMPSMETLYAGFNAKLPLMTVIVMGISKGLVTYGLLILIVAIALIVAIRYYIHTTKGRYVWDSMLLKVPIFGDFFKKVYASRFSNTLAGLVSSGVSLVESLHIVAKAVGNKVYEDAINAAAEKVKAGVALSDPIGKNGLFEPVVSQMIHVGEETGEMDNMLTNLSNYYDEEIDNFVRNISSIMEPAMIVVMGGLVAVILVAVMLPIYSISSAIH